MAYDPKDSFYRRAKKEGYRSRAAYKLSELNRRFHLIRRGHRVVDLGAAPGGWLQLASQLVGPTGMVVGVDIQPIAPLKEKNVIILQGDITAEACIQELKEILGSLADCVLSDLSPRLSGIRDADVARALELNRSALSAVSRLLKSGGNFLLKAFVGEEFKALTRDLEQQFERVQATRPGATRRGSSEIYLCAKGFQGNR